jgi:hypothetical protein
MTCLCPSCLLSPLPHPSLSLPQVPLSGGRGVLVCRFLVDTPPPSWYTQPTVLATVTATLLCKSTHTHTRGH